MFVRKEVSCEYLQMILDTRVISESNPASHISVDLKDGLPHSDFSRDLKLEAVKVSHLNGSSHVLAMIHQGANVL